MNILDLMNPPVTMELDLSGQKCELKFRAQIQSQDDRANLLTKELQAKSIAEKIEKDSELSNIDLKQLISTLDDSRSASRYLIGATISGEEALPEHLEAIRDMIRTNHVVNGKGLNDMVSNFLSEKGLIQKVTLEPSLSIVNSTKQISSTSSESLED